MNWDGSYITNIKVIKDFNIKKTRYWKFEYQNIIDYCIVKTLEDNVKCLIDELKPVFGLSKLGTHRINYNSNRYIMIKANYTMTNTHTFIVYDMCLSELTNIDDKLIKQVQEIYAFRNIVGLVYNNDMAIIIRNNKKFFYPISYREKTINFKQNGLSDALYDKWFSNTTLSECICRLTGFDKDENKMGEKLNIYRKKIEEVINRVDKNYIWIVNFIIERIMSHYVDAIYANDRPWDFN
jgi:Fe-S-cluster formation regulator IscX/YfhJ